MATTQATGATLHCTYCGTAFAQQSGWPRTCANCGRVTYRNPVRRVTLELPSGVVDPGEPPERAAARELREETGYEGDAPRRIGCVVLNPSWQVTSVHVFVVPNARRTAAKELDEGEDTRVSLVPVPDAFRMVAEGRIDASVAVSALALFHWNGDGAPKESPAKSP